MDRGEETPQYLKGQLVYDGGSRVLLSRADGATPAAPGRTPARELAVAAAGILFT
jgi:hypothetical protein